MDKTLVLSSIGILTLVGLGFALSVGRPSPEPQALGLSTATTASAPTSVPAPAAAAVQPERPTSSPEATTTAITAPEPLREADLMAKLHELQASAPLLSLQLAREGNQRFPNSADAAERTWYVVKSLSDLGRHDEARDEARKMLELFPRNHFTNDVVRHTLIHPPSPTP